MPEALNIVTGTIGDDIHSFGIKVIEHALGTAGFTPVPLGIQVSQEDFVRAAIESDARAILVSSMSGHARLLCEGLRGRCDEAGLDGIVLYVGGTLSTGDMGWDEIEKTFVGMGYTRAFPPTTLPGEIIAALRDDLALAE